MRTRRDGPPIGWFDFRSQARAAPPADEFARAVISAICRASVTPSVGQHTYERCLRALSSGTTVRVGFRHAGKADAIDLIWRERERLYREYRTSADKLTFLRTLPWIGSVTARALARDLGLVPAADQTSRAA